MQAIAAIIWTLVTLACLFKPVDITIDGQKYVVPVMRAHD